VCWSIKQYDCWKWVVPMENMPYKLLTKSKQQHVLLRVEVFLSDSNWSSLKSCGREKHLPSMNVSQGRWRIGKQVPPLEILCNALHASSAYEGCW
jgi:hypothetical protein